MKNLNKTLIRNQKGVTLIALAVTIIVLIILAGIMLNIGQDGIKKSEKQILLSELGMVQNAVLQRKTKVDLTHEGYPGQKITEADIDLDNVIQEINRMKAEGKEVVNRKDTNNENYYLLTNENGGLKNLGIKSAKDDNTEVRDDYIVNFETGEVINYTTKVTDDGTPLYISAE